MEPPLVEDKKRCAWPGTDPVLVAYHDEEWGVPVHDDRVLFEFLILEGAQAGLSWTRSSASETPTGAPSTASTHGGWPATIDARLRRSWRTRGSYATERRSNLRSRTPRRFWRSRRNSAASTHTNGASSGGRPVRNRWRAVREIPARTAPSDVMSADLKKRGFSFVGSTIIYAHMQAVGMVNDHLVDCFRYREVAKLGRGKRDGATTVRHP